MKDENGFCGLLYMQTSNGLKARFFSAIDLKL